MVRIISVDKNSYADKSGIKSGDLLISVNGNEIRDVLDYRFFITEGMLKISLQREGKPLTATIKKPEYDDIGLEFTSYLMDEKKRCSNNCIFCFIDQNPKGMRDTIYFKDDDERLSFLQGNYVTLTNLKDEDIARIIKMRISPINISVHTTNPELRVRMMRNRFAGNCLSYIKQLDNAGISVNAQLVLCRGINDGIELERSLTDLLSLENIESVAVVPCGLTGHRESLPEITPYDKASALEVISIAEKFGKKAIAEKGSRIVYPSDEFFLLADEHIPDENFYEDYPQIENGVGMIRSDEREFSECLEITDKLSYNRRVTIATGVSAAPFITELADKAMKKHPLLSVEVVAVENRFFGGGVTVSGLVTGGDIINKLKNRDLGETLLIPSNMLRSEGDLFLDGVSLCELSRELKTSVTVTEKGGYALYEAMTGISTKGITGR